MTKKPQGNKPVTQIPAPEPARNKIGNRQNPQQFVNYILHWGGNHAEQMIHTTDKNNNIICFRQLIT